MGHRASRARLATSTLEVQRIDAPGSRAASSTGPRHGGERARRETLQRRSAAGEFGPEYFAPVDFVGLYWHLVDVIWIFLFPLLYLIH